MGATRRVSIDFWEGVRGFMDSIYFRDPLGQRLELACYKFEPPPGVSRAQVLLEAQHIRVAAGARHIQQVHVAAALEALTRRRQASLSATATPCTAIGNRWPRPEPVYGCRQPVDEA